MKRIVRLPPGGSELVSVVPAHGVEVCVAATGAVLTAQRSISHWPGVPVAFALKVAPFEAVTEVTVG